MTVGGHQVGRLYVDVGRDDRSLLVIYIIVRWYIEEMSFFECGYRDLNPGSELGKLMS